MICAALDAGYDEVVAIVADAEAMAARLGMLPGYEGSIELIRYPCDGLDFPADRDGWRGMASLCFPVSDPAAVLARARDRGADTWAALMVDRGGRGAARLIFCEGQQ